MVVDFGKYHHARLLQNWLLTKPVLELVYLPPYSPELNFIEMAWCYMSKRITHNRNIHPLSERMVAFWKMFSHFQKPNEDVKRVCEINY